VHCSQNGLPQSWSSACSRKHGAIRYANNVQAPASKSSKTPCEAFSRPALRSQQKGSTCRPSSKHSTCTQRLTQMWCMPGAVPHNEPCDVSDAAGTYFRTLRTDGSQQKTHCLPVAVQAQQRAALAHERLHVLRQRLRIPAHRIVRSLLGRTKTASWSEALFLSHALMLRPRPQCAWPASA